MVKKENGSIRLGLVFGVPIMGAILYLIVAAGINFLFVDKIIPIEYMGLISKLLLFAMSILVCKIIKGRVRGEGFINSVIGDFIFCLLILITGVVCGTGEIDVAGFVICILISSIGCFLLFIKEKKYGKMHKKRRK